MGATSTSGLPNWGRPVTGILVGLFKGEVLLRLCWPVSTLPGLLKVGNMSVGNILKVTNPVYINHMIVLAAVDPSRLSCWLPFLLDAQCELHHFALEFLQLVLDCHFSLPFRLVPQHLIDHSLNLFLKFHFVLPNLMDHPLNLLMDTKLFALLCLCPLIEPGLPYQDLATRRVATAFQFPRLDRSSQEPLRAYLERHQAAFTLTALYGKVRIRVFPFIQDAVKSIPSTLHLQCPAPGCNLRAAKVQEGFL